MPRFRAAVAALAVHAAIAFPASLPAAADEATDAAGLAAVTTWLGALVGHDPAVIGAILAPEFQIQRSDGNGYDAAGYLDHLATLAAMPQIHSLTATAEGDIMVVRYAIMVDETINGQEVESEAPRLTVFRRDGDGWLVVAHANFSRIGPQ